MSALTTDAAAMARQQQQPQSVKQRSEAHGCGLAMLGALVGVGLVKLERQGQGGRRYNRVMPWQEGRGVGRGKTSQRAGQGGGQKRPWSASTTMLDSSTRSSSTQSLVRRCSLTAVMATWPSSPFSQRSTGPRPPHHLRPQQRRAAPHLSVQWQGACG